MEKSFGKKEFRLGIRFSIKERQVLAGIRTKIDGILTKNRVIEDFI